MAPDIFVPFVENLKKLKNSLELKCYMSNI